MTHHILEKIEEVKAELQGALKTLQELEEVDPHGRENE